MRRWRRRIRRASRNRGIMAEDVCSATLRRPWDSLRSTSDLLTLSHFDRTEGIEPPGDHRKPSRDRSERPGPPPSYTTPRAGDECRTACALGSLRSPTIRPSLPPPQAPKDESQTGTLQFESTTRGRFHKSEPTIAEGEDLDVPTFLTKGAKVGVRDERLQSKCAPRTLIKGLRD
jgi:hypothetical protein